MNIGISYSESPVDGRVRLLLKEGLSDEVIEEIYKEKYDVLWLYYGNFEGLDSTPIKSLSCRHLKFQSSVSQDVSWISWLGNLDTLNLRGKIKGKIDFVGLKKLRRCSLEWSPTTKKIIEVETPLESLSLQRFSGSLSNFTETITSSLNTLSLSGSIESLDGIERFANLENISLDRLGKLKDISKIDKCKTLKVLQLEACNSIEDLSPISRIKSLESVFFENKLLPSLDLFPKENLNYIRLGDSTLIEDKDVEKALSIKGLESISYTNKKGYKYSSEELNKLIGKIK